MGSPVVRARSLSVRETGLFLLCIVSLSTVGGENVLGTETEDFDFDGRPGAFHEFKVDIAGSAEECFYQKVKGGSTLHVTYDVLKGSDKRVDFYIRDEYNQNLEIQTLKTNGYYTMENATDGVYSICIDNVYSRFGKKLVYMSLISFHMTEWITYQKELSEVSHVAYNLTTTLSTVQQSVNDMRISQSRARFHIVKDWYLIAGLNKCVNWWSAGQVVVVIITGLVRVYTVRRLFKTSNVTPTTSKPRA